MIKYQTEQRKILLDLLEESGHRTFCVNDIHRELAYTNISISAIYRNLAELEKQGLVCKVNDKKRNGAFYQYVDPNSCKGVIHLKCQECQATFHLNRHVSQMIIGLASDEHNFFVDNSSAVLYGKCDNCSQKSHN